MFLKMKSTLLITQLHPLLLEEEKTEFYLPIANKLELQHCGYVPPLNSDIVAVQFTESLVYVHVCPDLYSNKFIHPIMSPSTCLSHM